MLAIFIDGCAVAAYDNGEPSECAADYARSEYPNFLGYRHTFRADGSVRIDYDKGEKATDNGSDSDPYFGRLFVCHAEKVSA